MTDSLLESPVSFVSQLPPVRIARILVENLFGALDHSVELNADARVTIMLGANGVGKTQVLECLAALFSARLERLVAVPFSRFTVDLDDGTSLRVNQESVPSPHNPQQTELRIEDTGISRRAMRRTERASQVRRKLSIQLFKNGVASSPLWEPSEEPVGHRPGLDEEELPPWIDRLDLGHWFDTRTDRVLTAHELQIAYGHDSGIVDGPTWFKATLERTSVRLIETQRLLRARSTTRHRARAHSLEHRPGNAVRYAVRDLIEDLNDQRQTWIRRYNRKVSTLDQTYVGRFLPYQAGPESTIEAVKSRVQDIGARRKRLEGLSLLEAEVSTQSVSLQRNITDEKWLVLSLFASDMDEKLKVLEPFAVRLEQLLDSVNRKVSNTGKRLVTDPEAGLLIETDDGQRIALEHLSSGEQHELVLLYDLLFRVQRQSLVLIDEPELSLHPVWQEEFVDDLMAIAKANEFDVVLATHSPYIVGSRSALCVTLKHSAREPSQKS